MNINDKINSVVTFMTILRIYRDPVRVKTDTTDVFRFFPNLQPYYGQYNRGHSIIFLKGTVPILYQNVTYYIPIVVWVPETYPFAPPIVILDPTPEMEIVRNHPQVSEAGVCHHQYLSHWAYQSNVCQVLKNLCDTYSAYPPLVTRKAQPVQPPPQPQPIVNKPPPSMIDNRDNPPPYGSSPHSNWNQPPPSYQDIMQHSPPVLPPKPQQQHQVSPTNSLNQQQQLQIQQQIKEQQEKLKEQQQQQQAQLKEKQERDDALQHCTEKLQVQLSSFYDTTSKEIENYMAHNETMEEQITKFAKDKEILTKDKEYYQGLIKAIMEKNDQLDIWISENDKPEDSIDIDAVSAPKDPLSKQLLALVSEDATIEDMLYYLDKALNSSRITLEEYLKNVRSLCRDQFMIRATIKKVHSQLQMYSSPPNNLNNNSSSSSSHHPMIVQ